MDQPAQRGARAQTFSNIFAIIQPALFNRCLAQHIGALHPDLKRQIIATDGKKLRGSHGLETPACHVVSAWAAESGLTLAQEYVADKSNELTAIPHLIEVLALAGKIVTLDAMGTHTHIAAAIVDKQADYILALKGNQGSYTRKHRTNSILRSAISTWLRVRAGVLTAGLKSPTGGSSDAPWWSTTGSAGWMARSVANGKTSAA